MNAPTCKVTIHVATSLDGYMASKDGNIDWMKTNDHFAEGLVAESTEDFLKTIDCFIMGSRTYELALKLGWPYGDVSCFVLTHRSMPANLETLRFHQGDVSDFMTRQIRPAFRNVWVVGGATVIRDFIRLNLVDEINLSVLPVLLGAGVPFLDQGEVSKSLHLMKASPYQNGVVELCYSVIRTADLKL